MKKEANARLVEAIKKIVSEMHPEAGRVDSSIMVEQLKEQLQDTFMEMAMDAVHNAQEKIIVHAATIMNQHNMQDTKYGRMNARALRQQIEDFEHGSGDDSMLMMQECATDIEVALDTFATQMAEYIVHIIGPQAR